MGQYEQSITQDTSIETTVLADAQDISGGVTASVSSSEFSLFASGTGGDNLKIELSNDGGSHWFAADESSEFSLDSNTGDDTAEITYTCDRVRVTNSSSSNNTTVIMGER